MKWEKVRLGDICDIRDGTHDSPKYVKEGYPLITSKNIIDKSLNFNDVNLISKEDYESINRRSYVDDGDILMPMIGTIGNPVIVKKERDFAIKNVALFKFNSNSKCLNKFIYYILESDYFDKMKSLLNRGGTQKFISLSDIRDLKIPLPPLHIQEKIAATLDKASSIIDKRKKQIQELNELSQSIFIKMFGDPVKNPMGWDTKELCKITKIETGSTPNRKEKDYYTNGNIPWIKTGEINDSNITNAEENITKLALKNSNCKIFPINTILIAMYGQGKTRGKCGILKIAATTNQACAAILPNDNYSTQYLFSLLKLSYLNLRKLSRGGNQPNLNLDIIKNYLVPAPQLHFQQKFASISENIEKYKSYLTSSLIELEENYKLLMQKGFNGDIE